MPVDLETDLEIWRFQSKMLHDMGHAVSHLHHLAFELCRVPQVTEVREFGKLAQDILEVSERMARYIRFMRLLTQRESTSCDFLLDVFQPAVWFANPDEGRSLRLRIDESARNAPEVTVRPTLAIRGLMLLLSDARSITLLCDIGKTKGRVILRSHSEQAPRNAVVKRGIRLLRASGAHVTPSATETGYSLALSFKQGHNLS